jgi:hypothetical protein
VAPIRICDNGGWTDTWFAEHGKIFNIGVYPYAEVQIAAKPFRGEEDRIVIHAENYGERYVRHVEKPGWDKHPLLEAAIECMRITGQFGARSNDFFGSPGRDSGLYCWVLKVCLCQQSGSRHPPSAL